MYCSKCGASVSDLAAAYCPKCGNRIGASSDDGAGGKGDKSSAPRDASKVKLDKVCALVGAGIVLIAMLPWLKIGAYGIGIELSFLNAFNLEEKLYSLGYGGLLSAGSDFRPLLGLIQIGCLLWIAASIPLVVNCVRACSGKEIRPLAFVGMGCFALAFIGVVCGQGGGAASQLNSFSSSASGIVAPTIWVWIVAGSSFCSYLAYRLFGK